MNASEGKIGRVFLLRIENDENGPEVIERFAVENGIHAGYVQIMADKGFGGMLAPDAAGRPGLRLHGGEGANWKDAEVVVAELLGMMFLRVMDPSSGQETLAKVPSTKTRVMERPAPEPEEKGPGTIPVYLFNAEFN